LRKAAFGTTIVAKKMYCDRCRAEQPSGNRFCGQCGSTLSGGGSVSGAASHGHVQQAGERRQITVMFYDMVGSTALAASSDPEDFNEVVDRFHKAVETAVRSFGGFVGSRVGDGAVVYFGYPEAQEDAAERAVLAGVRAVERTRDLMLPDGQAAAIRIGIATGEGVVNPLGEGQGGNEVVGSVANLASRLQSCAPRGAVVVSDGTRRVLSGLFDLVDIGRFEVKGFAEPVQAWRVAETVHQDRFVLSAHREETPLCGRDPFLGQLRAAFTKCRDGASLVILLIGEPGVGKSRLARAFLSEPESIAAHCITLSCSAHSKQTPLHPFVRYLRHARDAGTGTADVTQDAGFGQFEGTEPEDAALLAQLARLESEEEQGLELLTAAQRLERTINALVRQLELISRSDMLLFLFEDAHWADPTSLEVLQRAVRAGKFGRALTIITARPEFNPDWSDLPNAEALRLSPLDPTDASALLCGLPGAETLSPSVRRAILRRADGVPLFLQELTRSTIEFAAEAGVIPVDEAELPISLRDSLLARLDRLGPAKRIAQVAAVIGHRFSRDMLSELAGRDEHEVAEALDRLVASGLVELDRSRSEQQFVFKHVLIQEAASSTLLRSDRRYLNKRLLQMLEASVAEEAPARLAHYATEGGEYAAAANYWLKAGLAALAQSAMPEAKGLLHHGLACVAEMGDDPDRELKLQLALGKALIGTGGYAVPETGTTFERARSLCESTGNRPELLAVLHGLWIHDLLCGRLHSAQARADALLEAAETADDPVWILIACRAQGVLNYALANFAKALEYLERGLALFDPARRPDYAQILVDDPRVLMRVYESWVRSYLGQQEPAFAIADEALAEARELRQPYNLAHALVGWILVHLFHRHYQGLDPLLDELAELTREHEISFYAAVCELMRGRVRIGMGDVQEGCQILIKTIEVCRATGNLLYVPTYMMWLAEGLMRDGKLEYAMLVVGEAETVMVQTGVANDFAGIALLRGELQQRLGKPEAALKTIGKAIKVAEKQGAGLHLANCHAAKAALEENRSILAAIE
jgi:class 3 adenylate cyclase/tetratricopeptide (TPR) repeat protein